MLILGVVTLNDFIVVLDKKSHPPLEVTSDLEKPNHYAIYLKPPDESRNGKKHTIQLKVKRPESERWTTLGSTMSITLPKPSSTVPARLTAVIAR